MQRYIWIFEIATKAQFLYFGYDFSKQNCWNYAVVRKWMIMTSIKHYIRSLFLWSSTIFICFQIYNNNYGKFSITAFLAIIKFKSCLEPQIHIISIEKCINIRLGVFLVLFWWYVGLLLLLVSYLKIIYKDFLPRLSIEI